jgi:hypothetical protein
VNRLASRCQRLWVENNGMHGVSGRGDRGDHSSGDGYVMVVGCVSSDDAVTVLMKGRQCHDFSVDSVLVPSSVAFLTRKLEAP